MRRLATFILIVCYTTAQAQSAKTTIYDLIQKLIPNQGQIGNWETATAGTKSVKWSSGKPIKQIIGYNLSGDAKIDYGQRINCGGSACITSVTLNGTTAKAYDQIEFQISPDDLPSVSIEKILAKSGYQAKLLKKETEGVGGMMCYEVQFPGKPTVWMLIMTIPAYREEQSNDFSITVFFNKKDLLSRI